ncbi:MAG: sigma-70 family RNA polymerase sigma factor [Pedobacter sp.]|nr:MAG: sigma-70 family RNA polymerase sigma factor [Pedobacter sp.]
MYDEIAILIDSMAKRNCETSYRRLFTLLFSPLTRFSMCFLKSRPQAEEIASDVMLVLWQRRLELNAVKNVRSYAFITARNLSLNIIKKDSQRNFISLDDLDINVHLHIRTPEQLLINDELRKRLEDTINTLPEKGRLVFKLVKEDGFSYKEVAEILNISVKTVDAHLVASIKKLTVILKDEFNLA